MSSSPSSSSSSYLGVPGQGQSHKRNHDNINITLESSPPKKSASAKYTRQRIVELSSVPAQSIVWKEDAGMKMSRDLALLMFNVFEAPEKFVSRDNAKHWDAYREAFAASQKLVQALSEGEGELGSNMFL